MLLVNRICINLDSLFFLQSFQEKVLQLLLRICPASWEREWAEMWSALLAPLFLYTEILVVWEECYLLLGALGSSRCIPGPLAGAETLLSYTVSMFMMRK